MSRKKEAFSLVLSPTNALILANLIRNLNKGSRSYCELVLDKIPSQDERANKTCIPVPVGTASIDGLQHH